MRNVRLLWHIFPAVLLIALASLGLVTWYGSSAIRSFYYQQMTRDVEIRARLLQPEITRIMAQSPEKLQPFCRRVGRSASTRITVIASDGSVLADSNEDPSNMDNHGGRPEVHAALLGETASSIRFSKTLGHNRLYVALPVQGQTDQKNVLRLSLPVTDIEQALDRMRRKIYLGILGVIALATLAAYFAARRISSPLTSLQSDAEQLAQGIMQRPFNVSDYRVSAEIAGLAASLNSMAAELQDKIRTISHTNNELEAVFSSMAEPVVAIDAEEQIIRLNRAAARLFKLDISRATGQSFAGLIRNREIIDQVSRVLKNGKPLQQEVTVFAQLKERQLRTRVTPLLDPTDNAIGALIVMTDMTRIHRLENMRRDFAANVSHELKTPVTSIKGYVETLLDGAMDDRENCEKFLKIVARQSNRLDAIIDDLLSLARIEDSSCKKNIILMHQPIYPALSAAVQSCLEAAKSKDITIHLHCPETLAAASNTALLEQAVINLLTNAVTYSPAGSTVSIKAVSRSDSTGRQRVEISVSDQGPGIDQEHLERIFERFYRCDKARSRDNGGTGLGLAIVKHIAQTHGGTVTVQSRPGRGTVFTLTLPVEQPAQMPYRSGRQFRDRPRG